MYKFALAIFLVTFIVFNLKFPTLFIHDTTPATLLPFNILSGRGIYYDDYINSWPEFFQSNAYYFQKYNEHFISTFPLLPGIISIPVYFPYYIVLKSVGHNNLESLVFHSIYAERISASFFASITSTLIFIFIFNLSKNRKTAVIFALIYAFGTYNFSINSQNLWQHGIANLLIISSQIFLYAGIKSSKIQKTKYYIWALFFAQLSFYARLSFFLYLIPCLSFICFNDRRYRHLYIAIALVGGLILAYYNYFFYESITGSQGYQLSEFQPQYIFQHLAGLLFSPAKGALFYAPIVFIAFAPILLIKNIMKLPLVLQIFLYLNTFFLISSTLLISSWDIWWGGLSFGNREWADTAISQLILIYICFLMIRSKVMIFIGLFLICWSILIQLIGVYYFPRAFWDDYPKHASSYQMRFWDFQDNPISRNLVVGPNLLTYYSVYYYFNQIEPKIYDPNEQFCYLHEVSRQKILGYNTLSVEIINNSGEDWVTNGPLPIMIKQIYLKNDELVEISPIPSTSLPAVINNSEKADFRILLLPPARDYNRIILSAFQGKFSWVNNCKMEVKTYLSI